MAYRDENGSWVDFHSGNLIKGQVYEVRQSDTDNE